jgi:integrase/recombinase XerC/integrase/recombinase XerD
VALSVPRLERLVKTWILDGRSERLSPRTIEEREGVTGKLLWFLKRNQFEECDAFALRSFFAYANEGHAEKGGRWGNPQMTKAISDRTALAYYRTLKTFFVNVVAQGVLSASPMAKLKPPRYQDHQVQPFTVDQIQALRRAARRSMHPRRDEAIILFMLDTGCRASELCALKVRDYTIESRSVRVLGKGRKERTLYLGREAGRTLLLYLQDRAADSDGPLFPAMGGIHPGSHFTRSGLCQLFHDLGARAGIEGVRCSPHTCRHSFAVSFLRQGGSEFALKEILGHTSLKMSARYVRFARADIQEQQRLYSPADHLPRL